MTSTFCPKCGAQCQLGDQFCKSCGSNVTEAPAAAPTATATAVPVDTKSPKSAATTFFLCWFLGFLGIHRFYVGKIGTGILMLLTFGGLQIWTLIDLITIARLRFTDSQALPIVFTSADPASKSEKSGSSTLLLGTFLGVFGLHRFFVGKIGTGILMLLTFGGLGIWALIDVIVIALGNFKDKTGQFLVFDRNKVPSVKKIVFIGLAFIIAYVALVTSLGFFATRGLTDAARHQLMAMRAHDYAAAYSYTSNDFKRATSLEAFENFVKHNPALNDNADSTFTSREFENNGGSISGTLEAKDGSKVPVTFHLVKENGEWKILNIDINPHDQEQENNE